METFSHATQADLDAIYRHVPLPAPASTISIACTQSSRAFTVSFKPEPNGASRLITWGSIHIRSGAAVSTLTLGPGRFPPASPFTLYSSAVGFPVPGRYAINVELRMEEDSHEWEVEGGVDQPQQEVEVPEDLKNYARLATSFCRTGTPHDVCIDFAHVGLQLWGNQKRLSKQSPYFRVLLRNKDIETSTMHPPIMPPNDWAWDQYYGDSDDERDIPYVHRRLPGQKRSIGCMRKMKMVRIDDSAYSTFLAVLVWMETGLIFLAPLTPEPRPPITLRPLPLQSAMVDPPAVSPKSVFRVAKLLQLENLAELAMARILAQITPQNAIPQLYAQSSRQHADIIDNLVDYVVENWPDVLGDEQAAGNRLRSLAANPSLQEVTTQLRRALTQRGIVAAV